MEFPAFDRDGYLISCEYFFVDEGNSYMACKFLFSAPEFVKRLNAFEEVKAGSAVVFECKWKGCPKPSVKWYKDDEEITENSRYR